MRIEKWQLPRYFVVLSSYLLLSFVLFSPPEAKARRRHDGGTSEETSPRVAISRPFPNAKIVRNSDITYFFEQKKSLFPLLKKRGSFGYQKRLSLANEVRRASSDKRDFFPKQQATYGLVVSAPICAQLEMNASDAISIKNATFHSKCQITSETPFYT